MPLHLLGKKSWNVYNPENIARVQQDEAKAKAQEAERERRARDVDAEARFSELRGQRNVGSLEIPTPVSRDHDYDLERQPKQKKRRLDGEDDIDRDLSLATTDFRRRENQSDDRGISQDGHVDLISGWLPKGHSQKSDQTRSQPSHLSAKTDTRSWSTLGQVTQQTGQPWYSSMSCANPTSKGDFGSEGPRKQERMAKSLATNDPLAAMKRGVKLLKEHERERTAWRQQRERDLAEVEDLARKNQKLKKGELSDTDSLNEFDLEQGYNRQHSKPRKKHDDREDRSHRQRSRHHQSHRHSGQRRRSRSPEREQTRKHRRSQ